MSFVIAAKCIDVWMIYKSLFSAQKTALKSVNLEIEEDQIYGVLGPNGAGKTTLISLMATLLRPTKGRMKILGFDVQRETKKIRARINIASGNPNLLWSLTPYENLRYYALSYGINSKRIVEELITFFELEEHRNIEFNKLSTGNKQKVCLAKAFVNNPELVFLDEPTKGLDPDVAKRLRKKILDFQREKEITIVLTTHYMREAEMLCNRIAFLNKGMIVAEGTQNELKMLLRTKDRIIVQVDGEFPEIKTEGVYSVEKKGNKHVFYVDDSEKRLGRIVEEISRFCTIRNISVREANLEDAFAELAK
jgi:ABC-2 type transport system ATP-binding protein